MRSRLALQLPLIVFIVHTALVGGSAWMALRSAGDPLANVFFLPVMFLDMPLSLLTMPAEPLLEAIEGWLAPMTGMGEASVLALGGCLAIVGPPHWVALGWWIGRAIDRRRTGVWTARTSVGEPGGPPAGATSASPIAPPTAPPAREQRVA